MYSNKTKHHLKNTTFISKKILTLLGKHMIIKTVKISDKGQIAIPQSIRDEIGLERGDELLIIQQDGRILLEKSQRINALIQDDFKDMLKLSEKSLKKIWGNKKDNVWGKYVK